MNVIYGLELERNFILMSLKYIELLLILDVIKYVNGQLDLMGFGSEKIMTNR
ncbi:hypothetical protein F2Q68_00045357 [Brassica cretica]|uniref:Uncharacterized protein n=2 Tax=Brassica cretica TaxID=69181 RepID=A0A8S9LN20_BRACR|nr:hypothetical protein F2Q68_00045357 [Brassica cretica]KAF3517471.1 hypothetical protein DY000_02062173 [Brassica cretica]